MASNSSQNSFSIRSSALDGASAFRRSDGTQARIRSLAFGLVLSDRLLALRKFRIIWRKRFSRTLRVLLITASSSAQSARELVDFNSSGATEGFAAPEDCCSL